VKDEIRVPIGSDADILVARQKGRELAAGIGFGEGDRTVIAAAISEVARNIVRYAQRGEIHLQTTNDGSRRGLIVIARDEGPGIPDVRLALQDGYSTGDGFGLGLPGARRLMDEFTIESRVGTGTTVVMHKWVR
jgi:serine/threonine-protein kinase RsbT